MDKSEQINALRELVSKYKAHEKEYLRPDYNETQLRSDYLDRFFEIIGWDVNNAEGLPQHLRQVVQEAKVKVEQNNKKPDYAFRVRGTRKFFAEAKKPSVDILSDDKSSFQLRRYGWSAKLPVSILSNFKNLVIYDCRVVPKEGDNPRIARIRIFNCENYEKDFDEIFSLLSQEAVFSGAFDKQFELKEPKHDVVPIDDYFLSQIDSWRFKLAVEIVQNNPSINKEELNYLVQNFLNRVVFLRICEDRNLESYQNLLKITKGEAYIELLKLFKDADAKYNSGLFNFTKDKLSSKISVGDSVVLDIIKELYYPLSPYIFSVVESYILGDIYELFLKREIEIWLKRKPIIIDKPEASRNRSIVTTPKEIVDEIVQKTVLKYISGKSVDEIKQVRVADICCGSGSFLLATYQFILDFVLNWYLENNPSKYNGRVYKGENDLWFLSLQEKREILVNTIFGVDIDENAVEVTKFGLLIKLLENENDGTIADYNSNHKDKALPALDDNIKTGNSLVDSSFYSFRKVSSLSSQELYALRPFDWKQEFPNIFQTKGFDIILGNPPYTRIQTISDLYPLELAFYQSKDSFYSSCKKDNFDKYYLFVEKAIELLKSGGCLGYIIPHKFMKIRAGQELRCYLSSNNFIEEILHFGKEQVFGSKVTTYTCIIVLKKANNSELKFEPVVDFSEWKLGKRLPSFKIKSSELTVNPWIFIYGPLKDLLNSISKLPNKLEDFADIFVGLQTSNDQIYIIKPTKVTQNIVYFTDWKGREQAIERDIVRPCIYDLELSPFQIPKPNQLIIFPYDMVNGKATLFSESIMNSRFPKAWAYFKQYKSDLLKRKIKQGDKRYCYGRSQSLTKFDGTKHLIIKVLSLKPTFCYDSHSLLFTGGGNGPYYGISLKQSTTIDILYLLGILNSHLLDLFVHSRSSIFRAGYFSYGKQFIQKFPVVVPDLKTSDGISKYKAVILLVKKLCVLARSLDLTRTPPKRSLIEEQISHIQEELNDLIYDIYGVAPTEKAALKTFEV